MSMGAQMKVIEVALRANVAQYSAGIGLAAAQTRQLGKDVTDFSGTTEKGLKSMSTAAGVMGAGMLAGFAVAAGAAMRFDAEMSAVQGATSATGAQMDQLRQQALDAGQATVFSATEAATAQAELGKAGVSTSNIMGGALTGSLDLAAAGGLDLARAAEVSAFALNTFSLSGSDATHVADVLAAGANKSAADVDGMAQSLQQSGLVAAQFGVGLESTVGTLAMFAQAGLQGSDAGTSMKTMLTAFVPKSTEAADEMKRLGLNFFDANGEFVGLEGAAEQLQTRLGGLTDEQRVSALQTIFGTDAIRSASILYRQGGEGVAYWTGQVDDAGYAAELARIKNNNLRGDLEQLQGTFETSLIETGARADGALRSLTQSASAAITGFSSMPGVLDQVTIGFLGVGGAILTGGAAVGTVKPKYDELITSLEGAGKGGEFAAKGISTASTAMLVAAPGLIYAATLWGNIEQAGTAAAKAAAKGVEAPKSLAEYGAAINTAIATQDSLNQRIASGAENTTWFGDSLKATTGPLGLLMDLAGQGTDFSQMLDPFDENTVSNMEATTRELEKILGTAIPGYNTWSEASARLQQETGMTADEVDRFAQKSGIDLRGSLAAVQEEFGLTDEQVSQLAATLPGASSEVDGIVDSFLAARDAAAAADPETSALAAGFGTVGDQAASADEKLDAYKDTLDALIGVHLSAFDAETAFTQSLFDLSAALLWSGASLDINTEAGRKNRDAISETAQKALDHAQAVAEESGSIEQGNAVLGRHVDALMATLIQYGLTEAEAAAYIAQLGLTPENLNTLVAMNGTEDAKAKLAEINGQLDRTAQGATATITLNTAGAMAEALRLQTVLGVYGPGAPVYGPPSAGAIPGRAFGGPAPAGWAGPVNERGPELLQIGSTTMLMMGSRGGTVVPNHDPRTQRVLTGVGAGGGASVVNHYSVAVSVPNYMGDASTVVDAIKWPLLDAMRDIHDSRAGRDN